METTKILAIVAVTMVLTSCGKNSYRSSDLRLRDLQGNVASVTMNYETELFDENGMNVTPKMVIERDGQNRIVKFECDPQYDAGDAWFSEVYEYDKAGNLSKCNRESYYSSQEIRYIYEKGHLSKTLTTCFGEGDEWTVETAYTILESDEQGNWTKRKWHAIEENAEGTSERDGEDSRKIVYRK